MLDDDSYYKFMTILCKPVFEKKGKYYLIIVFIKYLLHNLNRITFFLLPFSSAPWPLLIPSIYINISDLTFLLYSCSFSDLLENTASISSKNIVLGA
jgi:hypothetical protein